MADMQKNKMLDSKSLRDDKIFMLIEISFVCNSSGVGNDG